MHRGADEEVGATHASPAKPLLTRKEVRLPRMIYSQTGYYYVTVCSDRRRLVLGEIVNGVARLSRLGEVVTTCIGHISGHFGSWSPDCYVVMPNHFHLVLACKMGTPIVSNKSGPEKRSLGSVVGSLKSAISKLARRDGSWGPEPLLQRGYFDHVVRCEEDLTRIREYILTNAAAWELDSLNPAHVGRDPFQQWLLEREKSSPQALWFSGDACVAPTKN